MDFKEVLRDLNCFYYVATSKDGKWVSDYVGDAILKFSGHDPKEFVENKVNWLDLIHPSDLDKVIKESEVLSIPPMKIVQEYRICHINGTTTWVRDIKQSKLEDEKFIVSGIVLDITAQKETQEKNQSLMNQVIEKNKQLQKLLDSFQAVNELLKNESSLITQATMLKMEKDIFPTLERLKTKSNEKIIVGVLDSLKNIFEGTPNKPEQKKLTKRESQILGHIRDGQTQIEISEKLELSLETVKTHVKNIKKKLEIGANTSVFHAINEKEIL